MHGSVPEEDPRRAEYRGAPVDFTQFPRPIVSSPHFAASPSYHVEDQSRVKKFRKPVVSFAISNLSLKVQISNLKEILLTSCIDILSNELQTMTTNEVKDLFKGDDPKKVPQSDYIAYIDLSGITLYPDEIPVNSANINMVIQSSWEMKNLNLSLEQLELLTSSELEKLIMKITGDLFENIEETIATLQNETSDAIASSMTSNCKFSTADLQTL